MRTQPRREASQNRLGQGFEIRRGHKETGCPDMENPES
jgi:hypothetical protein